MDNSGTITWTPGLTQPLGTVQFTMRVVNSGVPALAATNTFPVLVTAAIIAPQITSLHVSNSLAVLTWDSVATQTYRVQYKDNLAEASWHALTPDVTATGATTTYSTAVGAGQSRFYRVLLLAP